MSIVRDLFGYAILAVVWLLSSILSRLIVIAAWLMDAEEHEKHVRKFIAEREESNPIPKFGDKLK